MEKQNFFFQNVSHKTCSMKESCNSQDMSGIFVVSCLPSWDDSRALDPLAFHEVGSTDGRRSDTVDSSIQP